jgi:zinc D-Ala-D-Ala carboxypeptidase
MRVELNSATALAAGAWRWPHIDPAKEWACKGTGRLVYDPEFLDLFERMRTKFGRPLIINSGYRSPEHNRQVADTGDAGPHTTARAVDVRIYGGYAHELLALALSLGFTGIGVQQKGAIESRYLHLDILRAPDFPRPMIWTY